MKQNIDDIKKLAQKRLLLTRLGFKDCIFERDIYRYLGGMEAFLVILGKIDPKKDFEYKEVPFSKYFMSNKKRKETYRELILRLVDEYLIEQNLK